MQRRSLLAASVAWTVAPCVKARPACAGETPLRLGADRSIVDSGLVRSLQRAFGIDTGIAVQVVSGPASAILDAVKEGEVDVALTNAPDTEADLERQGLIHDRRAIARGEFMLVGPGRMLGTPAVPWPRAEQALASLRDLAATTPQAFIFLSPADGSGLHLAEQALWRSARVAPVPPWYASADTVGSTNTNTNSSVGSTGNTGSVGSAESFVSQVRKRGAFALVERGDWLAAGGAPLVPIAPAAAPVVEQVHAMRAFRVSHPAGKLFVAWIAGPRGRRVVARQRGYSAPEQPGRAR